MSELVTVIIPTYNRYVSLLKAIESVKMQSYKNIEIIVINDNSTDNRYYNKIDGITLIHLDNNTREKFKFPCGGYVRNIGLKLSNGNYIAFLDDDDYYFPNKIEEQLYCLENNKNIGICCTDSYIGNGLYNKDKKYKLFNKEHFWDFLKNKMNLSDNYPNIWNLEFIKRHNTIITSSVMFKREYLNKIGLMKILPNGYEDYDYWLRMLNHTNCYYLNKGLLYYNSRTPINSDHGLKKLNISNIYNNSNILYIN